MQPFKCPVCLGTGNVAPNFYSGSSMATSTNPETCRSCYGTGIIWGQATPVIPPEPPIEPFKPYIAPPDGTWQDVTHGYKITSIY